MRWCGCCPAPSDTSTARRMIRSQPGYSKARSTRDRPSFAGCACRKCWGRATTSRLRSGGRNRRRSGPKSVALIYGRRTGMNVIEKIEQEQLRTDLVPFKVGDTIRVHSRIREGDRERVQVFSGIVINKQGRGIAETFTVRRISYGEGVERVYPLHSPFIQKIEVERAGNVRRAKLYYLRKRIGKTATKVEEA